MNDLPLILYCSLTFVLCFASICADAFVLKGHDTISNARNAMNDAPASFEKHLSRQVRLIRHFRFPKHSSRRNQHRGPALCILQYLRVILGLGAVFFRLPGLGSCLSNSLGFFVNFALYEIGIMVNHMLFYDVMDCIRE